MTDFEATFGKGDERVTVRLNRKEAEDLYLKLGVYLINTSVAPTRIGTRRDDNANPRS